MPVAGDRGDRGVSETVSVAALVLTTALVTASVGLGVLFIDTEGDSGPQAEFTYDYSAQQSTLVVEHAGGDQFPAGSLYIDGPNSNVSWAALANVNETATVGEGSAVLLSGSSAYGSSVAASANVSVVSIADGNRTVLKSCSADCSN
jgi:hypothetical protein